MIYEGETVISYFELWDKEIISTKPTPELPVGYITFPSEILLTIIKPNGVSISKSLSLLEIERTIVNGNPIGRFRASFDLDGGAGLYHGVWRATTEGGVSISTFRVEANVTT